MILLLLQIGNSKSQRLISSLMCEQQYVLYCKNYSNFKNRLRNDTINATSVSISGIDVVQYVSGRIYVTAVFSVGKSSALTA
jgi:hypothetical protein